MTTFQANIWLLINEERIKDAPTPQSAAFGRFVNGEIILQDDDDLYFLNYLNQNSHTFNLNESVEIWNFWSKKIPHEISMQVDKIEELQAELSGCVDSSDKQRLENDIRRCQRIVAKYNWLSTYLDAISPENLEKQSKALSFISQRYFESRFNEV